MVLIGSVTGMSRKTCKAIGPLNDLNMGHNYIPIQNERNNSEVIGCCITLGRWQNGRNQYGVLYY
jgi:hypothetical protein